MFFNLLYKGEAFKLNKLISFFSIYVYPVVTMLNLSDAEGRKMWQENWRWNSLQIKLKGEYF